jgi:hypothetical protein
VTRLFSGNPASRQIPPAPYASTRFLRASPESFLG